MLRGTLERQEREEALIIDTDVLIWYLRGNVNAQKIIHANIPFNISAITYMELIRGMKDKRELNILHKYIYKTVVAPDNTNK